MSQVYCYHNFGAILSAYFCGLLVSQANEVAGGFAFVATYFLYFLLFEGALAATPGKLWMGLRVTDLAGRPCSWSQAGIRTAFRLVEVNPVFCGAIPAWIFAIASSRRQRLGDWCAGTLVIPAHEMEA